tara:strand:- start:6087 stop:7316 length:1230 start_codon:yes stop_codon:yes gene_type:complete
MWNCEELPNLNPLIEGTPTNSNLTFIVNTDAINALESSQGITLSSDAIVFVVGNGQIVGSSELDDNSMQFNDDEGQWNFGFPIWGRDTMTGGNFGMESGDYFSVYIKSGNKVYLLVNETVDDTYYANNIIEFNGSTNATLECEYEEDDSTTTTTSPTGELIAKTPSELAIEDLEEEIEDLQEDVDIWQAEATSLEVSKSELQTEFDLLQEEYDLVNDGITQEDVDVWQTSSESNLAAKNQLQTNFDDLQTDYDLVNDGITQEDVDIWQAEATSLELSKDDIQSELDLIQDQYNDLDSEMISLELSKTQIQEDLDLSQTEVASILSAKNQLQSDYDLVNDGITQSDIDVLSFKLSSLDDERDELVRKNTNLDNKLKEAENTIVKQNPDKLIYIVGASVVGTLALAYFLKK